MKITSGRIKLKNKQTNTKPTIKLCGIQNSREQERGELTAVKLTMIRCQNVKKALPKQVIPENLWLNQATRFQYRLTMILKY